MEGSVQISFIRKGTASSLRREGRRGPARPPRSPWQFSSAHTSDRSGRPRRSPRAGRRSTFGLLLLLHPCSFLLRFVTKVSPQSITKTGIRGSADHRFEVFPRATDKVLPDQKSHAQRDEKPVGRHPNSTRQPTGRTLLGALFRGRCPRLLYRSP